MAKRKAPLPRASRLLIGFNFFTAGCGFIFLLGALYSRSRITDNGWAAVVSKNASMVGVMAGMFTVLMSLVGCAAANSQTRASLCCYLCVFAFVWAFQVAAAVGAINFANQLQVSDETLPSGSMTSIYDIQINNAVASLYQTCCTGCPNMVCNNPYPNAYSNALNPNCNDTRTNDLNCVLLAPCVNGTDNKCFKFLPNEEIIVPPVYIDSAVCSVLTQVTLNKVPLVGPASTGACGGGDPVQFLRSLDSYVSSSLTGSAALFILVIVFEGLALPCILYLIFFGGPGVSSGGGVAGGSGEEARPNKRSVAHEVDEEQIETL